MFRFSDDLVLGAWQAVEEVLERHELDLELDRMGGRWIGLELCRRALGQSAGPTSQWPEPNEAHRWAATQRAGKRCEFCGRLIDENCGSIEHLTGLHRPQDAWLSIRNPLWIEHAVPRLAYQSIGLRREILESKANLLRVHKSVNQAKGTRCLTPDEIAGLWRVHQFGMDDEHAPTILLVAELLANLPVYRLPVLETLAKPVAPAPALGAFLKARGRPELAAEWAAGRYWNERAMAQEAERKQQARARRILRAGAKERIGEPPY